MPASPSMSCLASRSTTLTIQRGQLAVYLEDDLEAVLVSDGGAQPVAPSALDSSLCPAAGPAARYAFRYDAPPAGLRLRLTSAPSRLNADVTTVVSVRDGAVAYVRSGGFRGSAGRSFPVSTRHATLAGRGY